MYKKVTENRNEKKKQSINLENSINQKPETKIVKMTLQNSTPKAKEKGRRIFRRTQKPDCKRPTQKLFETGNEEVHRRNEAKDSREKRRP